MAQTEGIIQSVTRAWRLLNETGFMDISRGLNTEGYQRNVREAVRELREAARSLTRQDNQAAYGELDSSQRDQLWKSILAAQAPDTGIYIISRLGVRFPDMADHVRSADRAMSRRANGFPVVVLHSMTDRIIAAAPSLQSAIEREAARQGDPMPRRITTEEAELYQRIVLRAIRHSRSEAISHRNAGDAALEAFAESFLPAHTPQDILQDQFEGAGLAATLGERADGAGLIISLLRAVSSAADAHYRATNPEARLRHWIHQGCLAETHNSEQGALDLMRRLQDIKRRMDAWLQWLQRHQDHPAYVPPSGRLDPAPTASLRPALRGGVSNRAGPVQGPVEGAVDRGPQGLA